MKINKDLNKIMRTKGIKEVHQQQDSAWIWLVCVLAAGCIVGFAALCHASNLDEDELIIQSIIGEAEDQGPRGMRYIGCAIRNRGTLDGINGLNAYRIRHRLYSKEVYDQAKMAWELSARPELCVELDGATNWENIEDFGIPYWEKDMIKTYKYKDHTFYKEK